MPAPEYNPSNEVRFAVAMYGGVSLAIYINGIAQELFKLVRSTAPNSDWSAPAVSDGELSALEAVYREIGRRRDDAGGWIPLDFEPGPLPTTRFVVDIITGTSAGGINGILLAKALANGLDDIDALKHLWIEEGQLDDLLNEQAAYDSVERYKYEEPPPSLLAGDRLLDRAQKAIGDMPGRAESAPHYADELDLTVTMTDLQGLWQPLQLADQKVWETRHGADLKFIYAEAEATGQRRNDFNSMNALLAFAARATSSFPFAFAPVRLRDAEADPLAGEEGAFGDWTSVGADYGKFAFADGGYLQNKPISHATNHLKRRRANRPVERKLLYVEPDPEPMPADLTTAKPVPDALGNTAAALFGIPGKQPIRQDIEELRARNQALERIRAAKQDVILGVPALPSDASVQDQASYFELRRSDVVDALTDAVLRAVDAPADGATARAVRLAFLGDARSRDRTEYLATLDLPFALRRLNYVLEQIDELLAGGEGAQALSQAVDAALPLETREQRRAWLLQVKKEVSQRHLDIRQAGRAARARASGAPTGIDELANAVLLAVGPWLSRIEEPKRGADTAVADAIHGDESVSSWIEAFVEVMGLMVSDVLAADAAQPIVTPLDMPDDPSLGGLAQVLNSVFERAEFVDGVVYPMAWPDLREAGHVSIHRVSPLEADSLVPMPAPKAEGPKRLAGVSLGHFGGFLDRAWRRNDILWGRLDGAERLIAILVQDEFDRDELRTRAHAAILREEFAAIIPREASDDDKEREDLLTLVKPEELAEFRSLLEGANDAELVKNFPIAYAGPADLERARQIDLGLNASRVGGRVLAGNRRGGISLIGRTIGRLRPVVGAAIRFKERFRRS